MGGSLSQPNWGNAMFQELFDMFVRQRKPSLDNLLETNDRHIHNMDALLPPAPESKPRTHFDTELPKEKMSMLNLTPRQRLKAMSKGVPLFANMMRGSSLYDEPFKPTQDRASSAFIAELEVMARAAGAREIGYVKVPRNAIFQGKGIPCEYAIVFTVEMEQEAIETAPSFDCQLEVMDGYKRMSTISGKLTGHLRANGYAAYPGMALGGLTDYVHLAELAGIGAIGYHGLLIAPGEGTATHQHHLRRIYPPGSTGQNERTPMDTDFCAMCKKCVRSCPVSAIMNSHTPWRRRNAGHRPCDLP
ncbi:MAG: hypothetical protein IPK16_28055 [Anaerolineales bacterium]|nr:hypothetical protein [Anaerolineales bacterium]